VTDFPHDDRHLEPQLRSDDWLIAFGTALLALLLLGAIPHLLG
jgi:hypothetical protein